MISQAKIWEVIRTAPVNPSRGVREIRIVFKHSTTDVIVYLLALVKNNDNISIDERYVEICRKVCDIGYWPASSDRSIVILVGGSLDSTQLVGRLQYTIEKIEPVDR